jgi:ABC-2 type transport system permease protein
VGELLFALVRRDLVKYARDRKTIAAGLARPLLWLFAVGFGLRASMRLPTEGVDFVSFLVPGVAAMTVLFSSMFASISIVWDREFGFLKELLVAPVPRVAIVAAKMLAGSSMALAEAGLLIAVSPLVGARFSAWGALGALALLATFGMAVNALGIAIAAGMRSFEGFGGVVNFVIQPVFFLSGALYPLEGLPTALAVVVRANPMTYVVDAARGLMVGVHHFPLALDLAMVIATTVAMGAIATLRFSRMEA